jgi:ribA/ribD-fused uncharacterized protein
MVDKLFFYSKSAQVPAGKGTNEVVENPKMYEPLGTDFRQVLSNFHVTPFKYKGYTYNSIEHVFQAKKIELANPGEAYKFTLESGDNIGQGNGAVAQKNRKLVVLSPQVLAKWDEIKEDIMYDAALEKYKQNAEAASILKGTLNAELWHIQMRKKPIRFHHLEQIRDLL